MKLIEQVIVIAAFLGILLGCISQQPALRESSHSTPESQKPPAYQIQPGDQLDIKFFYNPELNETVFVRPDGKISLQLLDDVHAAGLTPSRLDAILTRNYSKELRKPVVTVIVRSFAGQRVYVGGEVNSPGLVDLTTGMTALQAVLTAGGFRETAKPEGVIVITKGQKNEPVPIRADLKEALYGQSEGADVQLHPYDIVYVPKTWIAEANKFVNQYVERLLLFRGTSLGFGFTYQVNRIAD
jgi:polysaccharide export outer membrane protein